MYILKTESSMILILFGFELLSRSLGIGIMYKGFGFVEMRFFFFRNLKKNITNDWLLPIQRGNTSHKKIHVKL